MDGRIHSPRADLAVHGLKDLPTAYTEGPTVAAILLRQSVADALVSGVEGAKHVKRTVTARVDQAKTTAEQLAEELYAAGGREILAQI